MAIKCDPSGRRHFGIDFAQPAGDKHSIVESVKAVSDLFAPTSMEILEVNQDLEEAPESINAECYGIGWLIRVKATEPEALDQLLDRQGYQKTIEERS